VQLSLQADYACRVLIFLATTSASRASIREIADAFDISENHLMKVVHRLGKLGFISNVRGRGGGIELARAPSEIRIGEVIRTMETHFDVVECFNATTNTCPISPVCGLKGALAKARSAFLETLDEYVLEDVVKNRRALGSAIGLVGSTAPTSVVL
jgi:Rrf2 family nitric oxide-sensitive transcriptional repressor